MKIKLGPMARFREEQLDAIIGNYASGALCPGLTLLFETQAALRPDVAETLGSADAVAAAFFEEESSVELAPTALDAVLDRIDALEANTDQIKRAVELTGCRLNEINVLPEPLKSEVYGAMQDHSWRNLSTGLQRLKLDIDTDTEVELYRIEPGAGPPRHSHSGMEATLVVAGGFTDDSGAYGPGDIAVKDQNDIHQPIADPGEPCYALAVRDGGLRFTGALGMVQRLFNL